MSLRQLHSQPAKLGLTARKIVKELKFALVFSASSFWGPFLPKPLQNPFKITEGSDISHLNLSVSVTSTHSTNT